MSHLLLLGGETASDSASKPSGILDAVSGIIMGVWLYAMLERHGSMMHVKREANVRFCGDEFSCRDQAESHAHREDVCSPHPARPRPSGTKAAPCAEA
jgi:hypothetical protein